ncbi:MAG: cyclase family protein [Candidatus Latescibacteria bacterium]|jgi:kynurenine formamidase|nr:cyclase family protein [Candidatus Latescibacterota bacterium]MDP7449399.1 cyclase family protein [Candidatus Latescibacterota bacterium]HJP29568.1 cyclase family protein [Candidatus Latescibacterota bacterium]
MQHTRRIIDLSTPLYDGIRGLTTEPKTSIGVQGYNTTTLHLYSHTGTHMDAPKHFVEGSGTIDEVDLQACVGSAEVIDLTAIEPAGVMSVADVVPHAGRIEAGSRVLLRTDWCRHVNAEDFRTHMPRVSLELARWFVEREVALLGVEQPSVASVNPGDEQELGDVHRALLNGGVVIVEGLCNLHELRQDRVHFVALPLRLQQGDGSPVRAIAIEE